VDFCGNVASEGVVDGVKYTYIDDIDCDDDGIPDPHCQSDYGFYTAEDHNDNIAGLSAQGFVSAKNGCVSNYPVGWCKPFRCQRPQGWCADEDSGEVYSQAADCDGDGIPDPLCANADVYPKKCAVDEWAYRSTDPSRLLRKHKCRTDDDCQGPRTCSLYPEECAVNERAYFRNGKMLGTHKCRTDDDCQGPRTCNAKNSRSIGWCQGSAKAACCTHLGVEWHARDQRSCVPNMEQGWCQGSAKAACCTHPDVEWHAPDQRSCVPVMSPGRGFLASSNYCDFRPGWAGAAEWPNGVCRAPPSPPPGIGGPDCTEGSVITIASDVFKGQYVIEIEPLTCGLYKGDTLVIAGGTASEEYVVILYFGSIILKEPLKFDHIAGTTTELVPRSPSPPPSSPPPPPLPPAGKDCGCTEYQQGVGPETDPEDICVKRGTDRNRFGTRVQCTNLQVYYPAKG
jgi:hypothetical protein